MSGSSVPVGDTSSGAPRLVVAAWGSAGDLLPFVAPVDEIASNGHAPLWVVPRGQSAYLRRLGRSVRPIGDGAELGVAADAEVVTTRDDGWTSWAALWGSYVAPFVGTAAAASGSGEAWGADAVIATDFGVHGRLAAEQLGIPSVTLSIYPQHDRLRAALRLPDALTAAVGSLMQGSSQRRHDVLAGAADRTLLLHDAALLGDDDGLRPLGFPAAPAVGPRSLDESLDQWIGSSCQPIVAVSMGSFLGADPRRWAALVDAVERVPARCILVGAPNVVLREHEANPTVATTPWAPLDVLLPRVDAVLHHGGLGTTFAAIRACCPAVVLPMAFDQGHNAGLVEAAGAGRDGRRSDLGRILREVVRSASAHDDVAELAARLVPSDVAVRAVATRCRELLEVAA